MEFLARFEAHGLTGRDANFSPSTRIASNSSLARPNAEYTEAAQLNALSRRKGFF
jgi:hypothetical protein